MQPKQPKAETQAMSEYGEPWILMIQGTYMGLENERGDSVKLDDARNLSRIGKCVSVLAGIPNPEAVRELIEAATAVDDALSSGNCTATVQQRQRLTWALDAIASKGTH